MNVHEVQDDEAHGGVPGKQAPELILVAVKGYGQADRGKEKRNRRG